MKQVPLFNLFTIAVLVLAIMPAPPSAEAIAPPPAIPEKRGLPGGSQAVALKPAVAYVVSGQVTDAQAGWPLYAHITITGDPVTPPPPYNEVWTDPATGNYSITLDEGITYTFHTEAWVAGYTARNDTAGPLAGDVSLNVALPANGAACTAPGYGHYAPPLLNETFATASPPNLPSGWAKVDVSHTESDWTTETTTVYPSGQPPHSSPNMARFNSYEASSSRSTRLYRTSGVNLSGQTAATVSLWMYHDTQYSTYPDRLQVQISTNGGGSWNNAGAAIYRYDSSTGWKQHTVDISAYTGAGRTDVRLGLLGISGNGNDIYVDDIQIPNPACVPQAGGLIVGNTYSAHTSEPLAGAVITNSAGYLTTTVATPDPAVADSFYTLFSPAGSRVLTATRAGGYGAAVVTATVVQSGTIRQDLYLPSGHLTHSPSGQSAVLETGGSMVLPITLTNDGGLAASFNLVEDGDIPWLSESPLNGAVPAGGSQVINLTFDATGLAPGIYSGQVSVANDTPHGADTFPVTLTLGAVPDCSFTSSSPDDLGETTAFTNTTTGDPAPTYQWDWGDGSDVSTQTSPTHTYTRLGSYTAVLTATNVWSEDVCNGEVSIEGLEPGFATNSPVILGLPIVFTNTTQAHPPATEWLWDLGDGSISTAQTPPPHTYTGVGAYTVTLTATNTWGSRITTGTVTVRPLPTLTVVIVGSGSVTRDPLPPYHAGDSVTLTAAPSSGWHFAQWSGDASGTLTQTTITMDADKVVTATFIAEPPTYFVLRAGAVGQGTVTREPSQTIYLAGTVVAVTAVPDTGWHFVRWGGDARGALAQITMTLDANKTVTATFAADPPPTYTLSVNTVGQGTVTREPSQTTYLSGTVVTLTAAPDAGWYFAQWSGDARGILTRTTLTMDADKAVTATFNLSGACSPIHGLSLALTPSVVQPGQPVTLAGTVAAGSAPITYTWDWGDETATDHLSGLSVMVTHTFPAAATPQTYTVTLAANNPCSAPTPVHQAVTVMPYRLYLPGVLRN